MTRILLIAFALSLSGCGLESAGTAAVSGKMQADQAKQGRENLDKVKAELDAASKAAEENRKKLDDAGK